MARLKAFIVSKDVGPNIYGLEQAGVELHVWQGETIPTKEQVLREVQSIQPAILVKIGTDNLHIKGEYLDQLAQAGIRIIGTRSTGLNLIDLKRATELNIPVVYAPEVPSVAENIIGMMIGFLRNHYQILDIVKQGKWGTAKLAQSNELGYSGKTLSIIGVGRIGKSLAAKVLGLGLNRILLHDIQPDPDFLKRCRIAAEQLHSLSSCILASGERVQTTIEYVDRETALQEADILSLNIPLTTTSESEYPTYHYLSSVEFAMMKNKPLIINTARGEVIDTAALIEALDSKQIGGASLDVIENEPLRPGDRWYDTLIARDNVVLFPHCSARTVQTFNYMATQVVRGILFVLQGNPPDGIKAVANPAALTKTTAVPMGPIR